MEVILIPFALIFGSEYLQTEMPPTELVLQTAGLIQKDFYFESLDNLLPDTENPGFELIKRQLARRISQMLDEDFGVLMQIFYRIDLNEQKVKEAIALADQPAEKLAELVLEREMQKAKTRIEYQKRNI